MAASDAGNLKVVRMLTQYGADLNFREQEKGFVALHFAARNNRREVCDWLLSNGCDPTITNSHGQSADMLTGHTELRALLIRAQKDWRLTAEHSSRRTPRHSQNFEEESPNAPTPGKDFRSGRMTMIGDSSKSRKNFDSENNFYLETEIPSSRSEHRDSLIRKSTQGNNSPSLASIPSPRYAESLALQKYEGLHVRRAKESILHAQKRWANLGKSKSEFAQESIDYEELPSLSKSSSRATQSSSTVAAARAEGLFGSVSSEGCIDPTLTIHAVSGGFSPNNLRGGTSYTTIESGESRIPETRSEYSSASSGTSVNEYVMTLREEEDIVKTQSIQYSTPKGVDKERRLKINTTISQVDEMIDMRREELKRRKQKLLNQQPTSPMSPISFASTPRTPNMKDYRRKDGGNSNMRSCRDRSVLSEEKEEEETIRKKSINGKLNTSPSLLQAFSSLEDLDDASFGADGPLDPTVSTSAITSVSTPINSTSLIPTSTKPDEDLDTNLIGAVDSPKVDGQNYNHQLISLFLLVLAVQVIDHLILMRGWQRTSSNTYNYYSSQHSLPTTSKTFERFYEHSTTLVEYVGESYDESILQSIEESSTDDTEEAMRTEQQLKIDLAKLNVDDTACRNNDDKTTEINDSLRQQLQLLTETNEQLSRERDELNQEIELLVNEKFETEKDLRKSYLEELVDAKGEMEKIDGQRKALEEQYDATKAIIFEVQKDRDTFAMEADMLRMDYDLLQVQKQALEFENLSAKKSITTAQQEMEILFQEMESLTAENDKLIQDQALRHREELDQMKENLDISDNQRRALEKLNEVIEAKYVETQNDLHMHIKEVATLKMEQKELWRLQNEMKNMDKQREDLEASHKKVKEDRDTYAKEVVGLKSEQSRLELLHEAMVTKQIQVEEDYSTTKLKHERLIERINEYAAENSESAREVARLQNEMKNMDKQREDLEASHKKVKEDRDAYAKEVVGLKSEQSRLELLHRTMDLERAKNKREQVSTERKIESLSRELNRRKERSDVLEEELAIMKKDQVKKEKSIYVLTKELDHFRPRKSQRILLTVYLQGMIPKPVNKILRASLERSFWLGKTLKKTIVKPLRDRWETARETGEVPTILLHALDKIHDDFIPSVGKGLSKFLQRTEGLQAFFRQNLPATILLVSLVRVL